MKVISFLLAALVFAQPGWAMKRSYEQCGLRLTPSLARWIERASLSRQDFLTGSSGTAELSTLVRAARFNFDAIYEYKRNGRKGIRWAGPWAMPTRSVQYHDLERQLSARGLRYYEEKGRDALDVVLEVFLRMSIENGKRRYFESQAFEEAQSIALAVRDRLDDRILDRESIREMVEMLSEIEAQLRNLASARKLRQGAQVSELGFAFAGRGVVEFPFGGEVVPLKDLIQVTRDALEQVYQISPRIVLGRGHDSQYRNVFMLIDKLGAEQGIREVMGKIGDPATLRLDQIKTHLRAYSRSGDERDLIRARDLLQWFFELEAGRL